MSDYRRCFEPGGFYFFTIVTYGRQPILTTELGRRLLRESICSVRENHPFRLFATVLMADHWHLVMQLPIGNSNYSLRIKRIKEAFTVAWLGAGQAEAAVSESQQKRGERGIWQPRFWEHRIRDEIDLERCVDYIHWNPRKHHVVTRVRDYHWSSFHKFVSSGQYDIDWGGIEPESITKNRDTWGEPV